MQKFRYIVNGERLTEEQWQASLPKTPKRRKTKHKKGSKAFMTASTKAWPMTSDGAGVHPNDIEKARGVAKRAGIAIDFTTDGQAIFRSATHRKEYCRFRGFHDRNGGYGDP